MAFVGYEGGTRLEVDALGGAVILLLCSTNLQCVCWNKYIGCTAKWMIHSTKSWMVFTFNAEISFQPAQASPSQPWNISSWKGPSNNPSLFSTFLLRGWGALSKGSSGFLQHFLPLKKFFNHNVDSNNFGCFNRNLFLHHLWRTPVKHNSVITRKQDKPGIWIVNILLGIA